MFIYNILKPHSNSKDEVVDLYLGERDDGAVILFSQKQGEVAIGELAIEPNGEVVLNTHNPHTRLRLRR